MRTHRFQDNMTIEIDILCKINLTDTKLTYKYMENKLFLVPGISMRIKLDVPQSGTK